MSHAASKQLYYDGGIQYNNPIGIADHERKLIWPTLQEIEPDIVVSIGTGYNKNKVSADCGTPSSRGMISHGKFLAKMALDHIAISLDSERTWREYLGAMPPNTSDRHRYFRLNLELDTDPPEMDDVVNMRRLRDLTYDKYKDSPAELRKLACRLVASCFYLELNKESNMSSPSIGRRNDVYGRFRFELRAYGRC